MLFFIDSDFTKKFDSLTNKFVTIFGLFYIFFNDNLNVS